MTESPRRRPQRGSAERGCSKGEDRPSETRPGRAVSFDAAVVAHNQSRCRDDHAEAHSVGSDKQLDRADCDTWYAHNSHTLWRSASQRSTSPLRHPTAREPAPPSLTGCGKSPLLTRRQRVVRAKPTTFSTSLVRRIESISHAPILIAGKVPGHTPRDPRNFSWRETPLTSRRPNLQQQQQTPRTPPSRPP